MAARPRLLGCDIPCGMVPLPTLAKIVALALDEDLGRGDLTSEACVSVDAQGRARLSVREPCVVCGVEVVRQVFAQVDPRVRVQIDLPDGTRAEPGAVALRLSGPAQSLLAGERVALNFVQRLSGVATLTRAYVDALPAGSRTRIIDTRKTTPGLRALERHAVRSGGGHNHREDLSAAVLIKDNHIAAAGGVARAIERARERAPHCSRIECEVDTLEQLEIALAHKADIVLLDNFDDAQIAQAMRLVAGRAIVEVSGGINLARIASIAQLGVDVISVGALTHSARAVDLGLDWDEAG
jgi:nicotinate-nucleotide pyrophosphorylase (carboxylating)